MLSEDFFARSPAVVARELLGNILVVRKGEKEFRGRIVETEAYFGDRDPASRAFSGKGKVSLPMWEKPGTIMVYNVHKYLMLNFVTEYEGTPSAVLIRAIEPLNFSGRTQGPGLLSLALDIAREDNFGHISEGKIFVESRGEGISPLFEEESIERSGRIGVTRDLEEPHRYFLKGNTFVSR